MAVALPLLLGKLLRGSEGTGDDGRSGVRARPRDVARPAPPWRPPRRGAASSGWSRRKARCSSRRRLPLIPRRAVRIHSPDLDAEEGRRRARQRLWPHHLHHHQREERQAKEGELRFSVCLSACLSRGYVDECCCCWQLCDTRVSLFTVNCEMCMKTA